MRKVILIYDRNRAAWCSIRYHGIELERGQLIAMVAEISEKCGITVQQTRTILDHLKSTNKITISSTPKFSIITLIDYDCNSENNKQSNNQIIRHHALRARAGV